MTRNMLEVPTVDIADQEIDQQMRDERPISPAPSLTIYGVGGCGINLVRTTKGALDASLADYRMLDTSMANVIQENEAIIIPSTGSGSGKVRSENAEAIQKSLMAYKDDEDLGISDINIVVFSLAGGTGSVAGPVLIRELARRGKQAVAVVISDTGSELDAKNTIKTLETLDAISSNVSEIYLPIMVFENSVGRKRADESLIDALKTLVYILRMETSELDQSDRKNWLNATKTVNAGVGMHLMHVTMNSAFEPMRPGELWSLDESHIYDSSIVITGDSGEVPELMNGIKVRVNYTGIFRGNVKLAHMVGIIDDGAHACAGLVKKIEDTLNAFNGQSRESKSVFKTNKADAEKNGGLCF